MKVTYIVDINTSNIEYIDVLSFFSFASLNLIVQVGVYNNLVFS